MKRLFFFFFFLLASTFAKLENKNTDIHIISKNIDLNLLTGTFYEIATNLTEKIFPGVACKCTKYEISELKKDFDKSYFSVKFSCERKFLFFEDNSSMNFYYILNDKLPENTTVLEEVKGKLYLDNGNLTLVNPNLDIIFAEINEKNEVQNLIFGGNKSWMPFLIISKEKDISSESYKRLLTTLFLAGYPPFLLNWPFIFQSDQSLC